MKPDEVSYTCNPKTPMVRWENSWDLRARLACFHDRHSTEQDAALIRWKVRTNTWGFPVTSIHAPWYACTRTLTHTHTHLNICIHKQYNTNTHIHPHIHPQAHKTWFGPWFPEKSCQNLHFLNHFIKSIGPQEIIEHIPEIKCAVCYIWN